MQSQEEAVDWFERYGQDVYNFLVYYTGSADVDIEDLVQETFIKAIKHRQQFRRQSHPKTWLIAIARRTAIDYKRKQAFLRLLPHTFFGRLIDEQPSPPQALLAKERHYQIYQLINDLQPSYRDVLILRSLMDWSVEETAVVLGWSHDKVNLTFYRAKQSLRKAIETKGGEGFDSFL